MNCLVTDIAMDLLFAVLQRTTRRTLHSTATRPDGVPNAAAALRVTVNAWSLIVIAPDRAIVATEMTPLSDDADASLIDGSTAIRISSFHEAVRRGLASAKKEVLVKRLQITLATIAVLISLSVGATPTVEYKDYPPDDGTGPTPLICSASQSQGQKCRRCHENVYPSGSTINWVCVAVTRSYSCKCNLGTETKSCSEQGECFYIG